MQHRRHSAGDREREREAERREHRALAPRAQVVMKVEPLLQLLTDVVLELFGFAHGRDSRSNVGGAGLEPATYGV